MENPKTELMNKDAENKDELSEKQLQVIAGGSSDHWKEINAAISQGSKPNIRDHANIAIAFSGRRELSDVFSAQAKQLPKSASERLTPLLKRKDPVSFKWAKKSSRDQK